MRKYKSDVGDLKVIIRKSKAIARNRFSKGDKMTEMTAMIRKKHKRLIRDQRVMMIRLLNHNTLVSLKNATIDRKTCDKENLRRRNQNLSQA